VHRAGRPRRWSWVDVDALTLAPRSYIRHLNYIRLRRLALGEGAGIHHSNSIKGPLNVELASKACIGNRNKIIRAPEGITFGEATLALGIWSKITSGHYVDCTASVTMHDYVAIGGIGTQIWTHGYVHAMSGLDRYRIDGPITIEANVYVGSRALISMGVTLGQGVIVGAGTAVTKDLLEPGLYVSSPVRALPRPADPDLRADLQRVPEGESRGLVYRKVPRESSEDVDG
jgi:acetyltransferase-like isoleucine patch superfamily enzyme